MSDFLKRRGHDFSHQTVSNWERGIGTPSRDVALLLAELYGVAGEEVLAAIGMAAKLYDERIAAVEAGVEEIRRDMTEIRTMLLELLERRRGGRSPRA